MEKVFDISDLNIYYNDFHAIKNLNIPIYKNKVTALIGPSGCGKSTFLRTLNQMNDLVEGCRMEGNIIYDDKNILKDKIDVTKLRTKVGMVFQRPNPFPMSIYENVAYGPRCSGVKNKKVLNEIVEESLKKAALWDDVKDCLNKNANQLSGGQQQRLCIARCIAMQPEVILMDEPTSALDPITTSKIESLIEELKKDYTIVIVTHSMQQASRISDYTAFFMLGELVEYNETLKIFSNPDNETTENYITGRFG